MLLNISFHILEWIRLYDVNGKVFRTKMQVFTVRDNLIADRSRTICLERKWRIMCHQHLEAPRTTAGKSQTSVEIRR